MVGGPVQPGVVRVAPLNNGAGVGIGAESSGAESTNGVERMIGVAASNSASFSGLAGNSATTAPRKLWNLYNNKRKYANVFDFRQTIRTRRSN